jgi:hypothetical protein
VAALLARPAVEAGPLHLYEYENLTPPQSGDSWPILTEVRDLNLKALHLNNEMHTKLQSRNLNQRHLLEELDVAWRIIIKWILKKYGMSVWTGCIWLRMGGGGVSYKNSFETSGSIKCREFLDQEPR